MHTVPVGVDDDHAASPLNVSLTQKEVVFVPTLRSVLLDPSSLRFSDALYMSPAKAPSLDAECLLWDVDDVLDDGSDLPAAAQALGFEYVLDGQTVAGIVQNARAQDPDASVDDLLEALRFYLRNDAFIVSSEGRPEGTAATDVH